MSKVKDAAIIEFFDTYVLQVHSEWEFYLDGNIGNFAFFHIRIKDIEGKIYILPGQITVLPESDWEEEIHSVLVQIVNRIDVKTNSR